MGILDAPAAPRSLVAVPSGVTGTKLFDPQRGIYNLKPTHLRRTRAALAKARANTGEARLAFVGDSTVGGVGATPLGGASWPEQLAKQLVSYGVPTKGSFIAGWKASAQDSRWSFPSGWGALSGGSNLILNSSNTNAAVFTSVATGTIARVYYANTGGPFTVSIDGAAAVTVTPTGASSMGTYEVTGLANTTHTISIARVSGGTQLFGAEVIQATNGLRIYNGGIGGMKASAPAGVSWYTVETLASAATSFNADAVFLMLETNDTKSISAAFAGTDLTTYRTNLQAMITPIRNNGSDLVLVTAVPSDDKDFGAGYHQTLYDLATTNDVPLIDLQHLLGTYTQQNGYGLMNDSLHPNAGGYAQVAKAVLNALSL